MFLQQRISKFYPAQFYGTGASLLGTTQKWPIDRTWPIEEILLTVDFQVTTALGLYPATAQSPDQFDNILQLIQHVNLTVNDGKQPRSVVDSSGIGLLEYAQLSGFNLDQATLNLAAQTGLLINNTPGTLAQWGVVANPANLQIGCYRITYRIPCAPVWVGDPLRSRMYLPVHTYPQDPVLTLNFQSLANIASAGAIGQLGVTVALIRRVPTAASEAALQKNPGTNPNGYIDWDLIETPFSVAPGVGTEQRLPLPIPGQYLDLAFRQYLGGANVTRQPIDATGTGATVAGGFGNEQRWRIETGLVVLREWRWKDLQILNDFSRPISPAYLNLALSSGTVSQTNLNVGNLGSPAIASAAGTGNSSNFRHPVSVMLNFGSDGLSGDTVNELGSLLDCNTPANNGLKMEIIGTPLSVVTNASYLYVIGRRFFGDLSKWQKFSS